jgi:hypothetical protein
VGQSGGVWYKETLLHLEDEIKRKNVVSREIDFEEKRVSAHFNDLRSHFSHYLLPHMWESMACPVLYHTCGGAWHVQYSHSDKKHKVGTYPSGFYSYHCRVWERTITVSSKRVREKSWKMKWKMKWDLWVPTLFWDFQEIAQGVKPVDFDGSTKPYVTPKAMRINMMHDLGQKASCKEKK